MGTGGGSVLLPVGWLSDYAKPLALPLILAGATLASLLVQWRKDRSATGVALPVGLMVLLWSWFVAAVCLALLGLAERPWYLALALPPLLMLSAHSVYLLLHSGRIARDRAPAHHVVVCVVWLAYMMAGPVGMQLDMAARQYHHAFDAPRDMQLERLVAAIKEHSRPDEMVFSFGYRPDLFWRADRAPATRFPGTIHAGV